MQSLPSDAGVQESGGAGMPMRIHRIEWGTADSRLFELRADDGIVEPATSGAHVQVELPNGLVRAYSVINPHDVLPRYVIAVKKMTNGRGGSAWLHDHAKVGMTLPVGRPRNHFSLHEGAAHHVLFAGGIGITPIRSMVQWLEQLGASWTLDYRVRKAEDALFRDQLFRFGDRVRLVTEDSGSTRHVNFSERIRQAPDDAHFYCCGPQGMLNAFEEAGREFAPGRWHIEGFEPAEAPAREGVLVVQLARSGRAVEVQSGQTILDAILAAGIGAEHSCGQGICGACETRVIEGVPDHRDSVLTPAERQSNQTMMICCSGARGSRLVLDL